MSAVRVVRIKANTVVPNDEYPTVHRMALHEALMEIATMPYKRAVLTRTRTHTKHGHINEYAFSFEVKE